jgi:hypothetical protein
MFMSRHDNARQSHHIKISNKSFEGDPNVKYLGMTLINQNYIHEGIEKSVDCG